MSAPLTPEPAFSVELMRRRWDAAFESLRAMRQVDPQDFAAWSRDPMAQAISDTLHADECADWIARDALRRDLSRPAPRHRALPRIAWAITVAVVVLGVAEVVELVGSGL